jgi:hypothetical protein
MYNAGAEGWPDRGELLPMEMFLSLGKFDEINIIRWKFLGLLPPKSYVCHFGKYGLRCFLGSLFAKASGHPDPKTIQIILWKKNKKMETFFFLFGVWACFAFSLHRVGIWKGCGNKRNIMGRIRRENVGLDMWRERERKKERGGERGKTMCAS